MSAIDKLLPVDTAFDGDILEPEAQALAMKQELGMDAITSAVNRLKRRELDLAATKAKLDPLIMELMGQIKYHEDKVAYSESLIRYLLPPGPDSTYANDTLSIFYSASFETQIVDREAIPIDYLEYPEPKVSKTKIKEAWKSGKEVPGARQVINYNLRIGSGGDKGKANKYQREKNRAKDIEHEES